MSKNTETGWYALRIGEGAAIVHLCFAEDIEDASKLFGTLAGLGSLSRLTWIGVRDLTGCIIPSTVEGVDFAGSGLMFRHVGRLVMLWPTVRG